jgi:ABC-2 type transport system permease protein
MTGSLIRKLLRDVRLPLLVVGLLLFGYQCLWAKITERIVGMTSQMIDKMGLRFFKDMLFGGPGKIMQTLMGGESIDLERAMDVLSIGNVHPLVQAIFCIWAVGRASGAVAGEIDRGTMELLLAQPVPRSRVVLAHLGVDLLTIPVLSLFLWVGTWLGTALVWPLQIEGPANPQLLEVNPWAFAPALANVAALMFAVSGYTIWLSARGRFRWRVLGLAVFLTLVQFLVNVVGQLWDAVGPLRPFTVFYYYQPQQIIRDGRWTVELGTVWNGGQPLFAVHVLVVLLAVGVIGYGLALWTFERRDLPAPL